MVIKKLEFGELKYGYLSVNTPIGVIYNIYKIRDNIWYFEYTSSVCDTNRSKTFSSLEETKKQVQLHFEDLIKSCYEQY